MKARMMVGLAVAAALLAAGTARADVFNMGDGLTSLEFVPVNNANNDPDTRYATPGYGAVAYAFNIGKFEVTAGQYTAFLNAVARTDTYGLYHTSMGSHSYGCKIEQSVVTGSYSYSVATEWANRPVNFVSWGDAARFANWLTNGQPTTGVQDAFTTEDGSYYLNGATTNAQLLLVTRKTPAEGGRYYVPTEDEWYKAAYHQNDGVTGNYWSYPTAANSAPSPVLADPDQGNNANYWAGSYTIDSPYYRTPVGEFENSESPYGTFDQGGNVWEWNEGIADSSCRVLRGGSFEFAGYVNGYDLSAAVRSHNDPTTESYNIGFRIAEVPEPATLSLLGLGAVGLLLRRRHR